MNNNQLRLEQFDTVLYNANLNPMGAPDSAIKAMENELSSIVRYPNDYYDGLKDAISQYAKCKKEHILLGNSSSDLLHRFVSQLKPEKTMLLAPCYSEYENVLTAHGCEVDFFELKEEEDFEFNIAEFVGVLNSSYDMIIIGNPNNPTSKLISKDDLETLAAVCEELGTFLLIDEMYIEFVNQTSDITCLPLVEDYQNIAILRSVSKFFAVPGIRLAYAVMNNTAKKSIINAGFASNNISTLSAVACMAMLRDTEYILESNSQIYTERNLIYSAMSTNKNIKLYKPAANFMLAKILKPDVNASIISEHCKLKGIIIRNCESFRGLDDSYIRFCFMKPSQNDTLVNSILELLN